MADNLPAGAGQAVSEEYDKAVAQLRESAKWLLTIFAAVGAVLISGTQLSKIGQMAADWRLVVAVAAFAIGLVAVGTAILSVLRVLSSGSTSVAALRREQDTRPNGAP